MNIIQRMFFLLSENNLKQKDLSEHIGISTSTISTWKSTNKNPPAEKIPDIADFLGVSIEYLLTGEEKHADSKSIHIGGSVGNNSINNNYSELNSHDKELLTEYNKLSFKDKAKVMNLIAELEECYTISSEE